jgi:hypothetical protein
MAGVHEVADLVPAPQRALLLDGFRVEAAQRVLVVRPALAVARAVRVGDREVVDALVRAVPATARLGGLALRRASTGFATGYLVWVVAGAIAAGVVGVVLA